MAGFVTLTRKGPDPGQLVADLNRDLTKGVRASGREAAKVGVKAFKSASGVSHFGGHPLRFKAKKTTATPTKAHVDFQASPVGFWCIVESGAKPHKIRARKAKALAFGNFVGLEVDHPGMAGRGSYSRGEAAAIRAIEESVEDTIVEAVT